mgnify:CR=1 FL=1
MIAQALTTWGALTVLSLGARLAMETSGTVIDQRARELLQRTLDMLQEAESAELPQTRLQAASQGIATLEAARYLASDIHLERLCACDVNRLSKDLERHVESASLESTATQSSKSAGRSTQSHRQ